MKRLCIKCERASAVAGRSRCSKCGPTSPRGPSIYDHHYQELRSRTLRDDKLCHICGGGPRANDPLQADHVIPHSLGGPTTADNLRPAHRSCNVRKGGANRKRNLK